MFGPNARMNESLEEGPPMDSEIQGEIVEEFSVRKYFFRILRLHSPSSPKPYVMMVKMQDKLRQVLTFDRKHPLQFHSIREAYLWAKFNWEWVENCV